MCPPVPEVVFPSVFSIRFGLEIEVPFSVTEAQRREIAATALPPVVSKMVVGALGVVPGPPPMHPIGRAYPGQGLLGWMFR